MEYIVGVDIGGTFTDCVVVDESGTVVLGKALSTPKDFSMGAINAIEQMDAYLRKNLQHPDTPAELRDPKNWPEEMRKEWGNDEGRENSVERRVGDLGAQAHAENHQQKREENNLGNGVAGKDDRLKDQRQGPAHAQEETYPDTQNDSDQEAGQGLVKGHEEMLVDLAAQNQLPGGDQYPTGRRKEWKGTTNAHKEEKAQQEKKKLERWNQPVTFNAS